MIIDRGYFKLGMSKQDSNGNVTTVQEPEWVSDNKANGIAIGIEGQIFNLFSIYDRKDIYKEIKRLLELKGAE